MEDFDRGTISSNDSRFFRPNKLLEVQQFQSGINQVVQPLLRIKMIPLRILTPRQPPPQQTNKKANGREFG
jgi:hypothetical protein